MNQLHHDEQMEALRRDFAILWKEELLVQLHELGVFLDSKLPAIEHVAWNAYRLGIKRAP